MTSSGEASDTEARRIWLGVVAESPNAWRARATSAAGLLSAAAAAALTGLLLHPPALNGGVLDLVVLAAVSYVLAVLLLLSASVWPSPRIANQNKPMLIDIEQGDGYAEQMVSYCTREARPLRNLTIAGSVFGAMAVLATAGAAVFSLAPDSRMVEIRILDSAQQSGLQSVCPNVGAQFIAKVRDQNDGQLRVTVRKAACGPAERTFILPKREDAFISDIP
jgi:hypothetical protein